MMKQEIIKKILEFRKKDSPELQAKKEEFLEWLNINHCDYGKPIKVKIEGMNSKYRTKGLQFDEEICYNPQLKHFEMYEVGEDEPVKTKYKDCQFVNLNANIRTKVNSETCLETDKIPDFNKACSFIVEICRFLIRNHYNFFVWYAEGQRSPHIRIYDFEELNYLNPEQRIKAQIEFWKKHVPFGMFHLIDSGIFVDNHPLQLEYALHYKYKTPFLLLFEYKPEVITCKD